MVFSFTKIIIIRLGPDVLGFLSPPGTGSRGLDLGSVGGSFGKYNHLFLFNSSEPPDPASSWLV